MRASAPAAGLEDVLVSLAGVSSGFVSGGREDAADMRILGT
jgi:hypothetical protein